MIRRQISSPQYTINHTEQPKEYKPTVMMFMDCEMRPTKNITELYDIKDLYTHYGTNSNNYNFNVAELLLGTNNVRILGINANYDENNYATLGVYTSNNTTYSIHPSYTSFDKVNKSASFVRKMLTNGNYSYTITFDSLEKNYYILLPYTNIAKILIYLVYDRNTFERIVQQETDTTHWYNNMYNEDDSLQPYENWTIDLDETWESFLNKVAKILTQYGLNVSINYKNHSITITYTYPTNFIVGNLDVDYNNSASDELIYQVNRNSIKLLGHTKFSTLLDNVSITIEQYNVRYYIEIVLYDNNGSIVDTETYDGTNVDELIETVNFYSSYVYIDEYSEQLPIGLFWFKNYEESEIITESDYTDRLFEITEETIKTNRIDIIYNRFDNDNIDNYFIELTNSCNTRCNYFTFYNKLHNIGNNETVFNESWFTINNTDYDIMTVLLYNLLTVGGVEFDIPYNLINYSERYMENEEIVNNIVDVQDNYYYYSMLNPLCTMNGNLTTLAESLGAITQLNYIINEVNKDKDNLDEKRMKDIVLKASINIGKYFDNVPKIILDNFTKQERTIDYSLTITLINNHNITYDFNIDITY